MIEPCKEAKCISYPICLNKYYIELLGCDLLAEYITEHIRQGTKYDKATEKEVLRHLKTTFPNPMHQYFKNKLNNIYNIRVKTTYDY